MTKNDKKAMTIALVFIALACYYFLIPNRNWLGKPYLETAQNDWFAVVELFTSEGCSTCPPADALMAKIQKESTGKNVYLLAFHVDYWDNLGWRDRFSSASFTERQQQYANRMKRDLIYTPQFIVNGTSEFGGDDARMLYHLISNALEEAPADHLALTAHQKGDSLLVDYKANKAMKNSSLFIAVVQKNASSNVQRGENGGHLLHHVQVVRKGQILALDNAGGSTVMSKPEGFNSSGWELIGFIQNNATGAITAAAKTQFE